MTYQEVRRDRRHAEKVGGVKMRKRDENERKDKEERDKHKRIKRNKE